MISVQWLHPYEVPAQKWISLMTFWGNTTHLAALIGEALHLAGAVCCLTAQKDPRGRTPLRLSVVAAIVGLLSAVAFFAMDVASDWAIRGGHTMLLRFLSVAINLAYIGGWGTAWVAFVAYVEPLARAFGRENLALRENGSDRLRSHAGGGYCVQPAQGTGRAALERVELRSVLAHERNPLAPSRVSCSRRRGVAGSVGMPCDGMSNNDAETPRWSVPAVTMICSPPRRDICPPAPTRESGWQP